jgi:hypothetical protein
MCITRPGQNKTASRAATWLAVDGGFPPSTLGAISKANKACTRPAKAKVKVAIPWCNG